MEKKCSSFGTLWRPSWKVNPELINMNISAWTGHTLPLVWACPLHLSITLKHQQCWLRSAGDVLGNRPRIAANMGQLHNRWRLVTPERSLSNVKSLSVNDLCSLAPQYIRLFISILYIVFIIFVLDSRLRGKTAARLIRLASSASNWGATACFSEHLKAL